MSMNVTQKLIHAHLEEGEMAPGKEIGLRIDQTLTQDATGTMVMLELEAMGLEKAATELSAQYVDHNLIQADNRNPDDHLFLESACQRFGIWYSRPGNGVSHPVHMEHFGAPGRTLLGSDSHTCAAGSLGMLAIGAGGIDVAAAIAGRPFYVKMPEVMGVRLTGALPDWVSAKDVILEMLRRHGVSGGVGRVIEYHGPGLAGLSAMDRHVIANMGAELGATTTVFPSDEHTRDFLERRGRADVWQELAADGGAVYDLEDEIDLSRLEPLIARPTSPGNVVPVREAAGESMYQAYIGSSANPGYRDIAVCAEIVRDRQMPPTVSFDINPTSRAILHDLIEEGHFARLVKAGARIHQSGCNGCIGMGQAPATGRNSLRTVPRNFPGRSGTREDAVFLCSPETATVSALRGEITDPRSMGEEMGCPRIEEPARPSLAWDLLEAPPAGGEPRPELVKGPNISTLPEFDPPPERLELEVLLKMGDDISTDEIMPAGARVLPFRSNIQEISRFCFDVVDDSYHDRAAARREEGRGHCVVAGRNYGQGSSREHAALAPRFLGLRLVLAVDFARIHWQNLVNFGVFPIEFEEAADLENVEQGAVLTLEDVRGAMEGDGSFEVQVNGETVKAHHRLSDRQKQILLAGGVINQLKARK